MAIQMEYRGSAPTDDKGVLDCFVQQPVDNTPSADKDGRIIYTEKWKGPYKTAIDILDDIKVGMDIAVFHQWLGANKISCFDPPAPPKINKDDTGTDNKWIISNIRVQELTAGDHAIIVVEFGANLQKLQDSDTWSVSWQAYTVTPYEFCSGKVHEPLTISPSFGVGQTELNWSIPASRQMIEQYRSHSPQIVKGTDGTAENNDESDITLFVYKPNPEDEYDYKMLSMREMEVLKKLNQGRNATYHYPIVTHSVSYIGTEVSAMIDQIGSLGSDLDTAISSLPSECPYSFADFKQGSDNKNWIWLKIGDDITQAKTGVTIQFNRKETWAGYNDVDMNYYGSQPFSDSKEGVLSGRWYKNCL